MIRKSTILKSLTALVMSALSTTAVQAGGIGTVRTISSDNNASLRSKSI